MAPDRSVRIEFDNSGNGEPGAVAPDAPESRPSKYRNAGLVILVIALLGAVFFALRPTENETAARTDRATATTATSFRSAMQCWAR